MFSSIFFLLHFCETNLYLASLLHFPSHVLGCCILSIGNIHKIGSFVVFVIYWIELFLIIQFCDIYDWNVSLFVCHLMFLFLLTCHWNLSIIPIPSVIIGL